MNDFFYDPWTDILAFFFIGAVIGAIYDVFRILRVSRSAQIAVSGKIADMIKPRKTLKLPKLFHAAGNAATFFEDILFWLCAAVVETVFVYQIGGGELRMGYVAFTAVGFAAYYFTLGKAVISVSEKIIFLCRCLIFWSFYIIMYPIMMVFRFILKKIHCFSGKIREKRADNHSKKRMQKILYEVGRGFGVPAGGEDERKNEFACAARRSISSRLFRRHGHNDTGKTERAENAEGGARKAAQRVHGKSRKNEVRADSSA